MGKGRGGVTEASFLLSFPISVIETRRAERNEMEADNEIKIQQIEYRLAGRGDLVGPSIEHEWPLRLTLPRHSGGSRCRCEGVHVTESPGRVRTKAPRGPAGRASAPARVASPLTFSCTFGSMARSTETAMEIESYLALERLWSALDYSLCRWDPSGCRADWTASPSRRSDGLRCGRILGRGWDKCKDVEAIQGVPWERLGDIRSLAVLLRQHNWEVTEVKSLNDRFLSTERKRKRGEKWVKSFPLWVTNLLGWAELGTHSTIIKEKPVFAASRSDIV